MSVNDHFEAGVNFIIKQSCIYILAVVINFPASTL